MGNRFKLETVLLTHKTHKPLALATLIAIYFCGVCFTRFACETYQDASGA